MNDQTPSVSPAGALAMLALRAEFIDVREQDEWDSGHAPQARHLALALVGANLHTLRTTTPIVVICRSGHRSLGVTKELLKDGFNAFNLEGGMQAWQLAGFDVVRTDGTTGTVI